MDLANIHDAHAGIAYLFVVVNLYFMIGGSILWVPLGSSYARSLISSCFTASQFPIFNAKVEVPYVDHIDSDSR